MSTLLATTFGFLLAAFLGGLELWILYLMATGKIDLTHLVSEKNGPASLSRFQFLIFTFVIAVSFFVVVANDPTGLPDVPSGVFGLLGISGGSYVVSKAIQGAGDGGGTGGGASGGRGGSGGGGGTGE